MAQFVLTANMRHWSICQGSKITHNVFWKAACSIGYHATFTKLHAVYGCLHGICHLAGHRPEDKTVARIFVSLPPCPSHTPSLHVGKTNQAVVQYVRNPAVKSNQRLLFEATLLRVRGLNFERIVWNKRTFGGLVSMAKSQLWLTSFSASGGKQWCQRRKTAMKTICTLFDLECASGGLHRDEAHLPCFLCMHTKALHAQRKQMAASLLVRWHYNALSQQYGRV
jgi:hypothetical protein